MLIDPVEIVEVGRNIGALQLRTVRLIERPPFLALAAIVLRRAIQVLALAEVEAGQVAARRQRRPDDAVAVDVDAARIEARLRDLEDLGLAGCGRVVEIEDLAKRS